MAQSARGGDVGGQDQAVATTWDCCCGGGVGERYDCYAGEEGDPSKVRRVLEGFVFAKGKVEGESVQMGRGCCFG